MQNVFVVSWETSAHRVMKGHHIFDTHYANYFWLVPAVVWYDIRDLTQLGRERRRRQLPKFELPVFPFLISITHSFLLKFLLKLCEQRKIKTLILKPHGDWNDSCFVVHVLWKQQNWAFQVLFTKEDDRKVARWLHSHVKSLYFVT